MINWELPARILRSPIVKSVTLVPVAGYIILYSDELSSIFDLQEGYENLGFLPESWRIHLIYWGGIFLTIGIIIYSLKCPPKIKRLTNADTFALEQWTYKSKNNIVLSFYNSFIKGNNTLPKENIDNYFRLFNIHSLTLESHERLKEINQFYERILDGVTLSQRAHQQISKLNDNNFFQILLSYNSYCNSSKESMTPSKIRESLERLKYTTESIISSEIEMPRETMHQIQVYNQFLSHADLGGSEISHSSQLLNESLWDFHEDIPTEAFFYMSNIEFHKILSENTISCFLSTLFCAIGAIFIAAPSLDMFARVVQFYL